MPWKVNLVRYMSEEELAELYRDETNPRIKERLQAILLLYEGRKTQEVADIVKRARSTIENWIKLWNENGYEGLVPEFKGGPKPKLSDEEWEKIKDEIKDRGMDIKDVIIYVKETRGVKYRYGAAWKALRGKMHVKYGKPYPKNEARPEDAEGILKKT